MAVTVTQAFIPWAMEAKLAKFSNAGQALADARRRAVPYRPPPRATVTPSDAPSSTEPISGEDRLREDLYRALLQQTAASPAQMASTMPWTRGQQGMALRAQGALLAVPGKACGLSPW